MDEQLKNEIRQQAIQIVEEKETVPTVKSEQPVDFQSLQNKYLEEQVGQGKTISEIASDFAKAQVTSDLLKNEDGKYDKLHQDLAKEQEETLKASFEKDKVKEQTATLTEKQKKAEAFYTSFRPILEFDFTHLVKSNNKDKEKEQKTYSDRSYGIVLMCLMLTLFMIPYCAVSLLLAVFNGINAIFVAISTFSKTAKVIVWSILIIAFGVLLVYSALMGIDYAFGTNIITKIIK